MCFSSLCLTFTTSSRGREGVDCHCWETGELQTRLFFVFELQRTKGAEYVGLISPRQQGSGCQSFFEFSPTLMRVLPNNSIQIPLLMMITPVCFNYAN